MAQVSATDDDLWQYAMDDLSRTRQDELPLESYSRRGPGYAPTRRNGTDHIPAKTKLELKKAWCSTIRDEESEQMEGLASEDAPWRRGFERNYPPKRKSELLPKPSKKVERPLSKATGANAIQVRTPGRAFIHAQKHKAATDPPVSFAPVIHPTQTSPRESFQKQLESCDIVYNVPEVPPGENGSPETCSFYWGRCMVYPAKHMSNWFVAKFEMATTFASTGICFDGSLYLSAEGLAPREHKFYDLSDPTVVDGFCILATKKSGGPSYRLQLKDNEATKRFHGALCFIQNMVLNNRLQAVQTTLQTALDQTVQVDPKIQEALKRQEDTKLDSIREHTPTRAPDASASTCKSKKGDQNHQVPKGPTEMAPLLDFEEDSNSQSSPGVDFQNTAKRCVRLLDQLAEAKLAWGACLDIPESVGKAVMEVLNEKYSGHEVSVRQDIAKGFVALADSLADLKNQERSLLSIRRTPKTLPESMKGLLQPITYSPENIMKLKKQAVVPPSGPALLKGPRSGDKGDRSWLGKVWLKPEQSQQDGHEQAPSLPSKPAPIVSVNSAPEAETNPTNSTEMTRADKIASKLAALADRQVESKPAAPAEPKEALPDDPNPPNPSVQVQNTRPTFNAASSAFNPQSGSPSIPSQDPPKKGLSSSMFSQVSNTTYRTISSDIPPHETKLLGSSVFSQPGFTGSGYSNASHSGFPGLSASKFAQPQKQGHDTTSTSKPLEPPKPKGLQSSMFA